MKMGQHILTLAFLVLGIRDTFQSPIKIQNDPNVPFIEAFFSSFSDADFGADAHVVRHASPDVVKFKNLPDHRNGTTVFNQKSYKTEAKKVIVLSGYDDYIRRSDSNMTEQRVFVTLTKKSGTDDFYYVNYAYVRDVFPGENTEGTVNIGGKIRRIEVDTWDRRGADTNLETRMGWSFCAKSFFISCLGDPKLLYSYGIGDEPDYPDEIGESIRPSNEPHPPKLEDPNEPASVQYYHDFFTDLADEFTHSWFVGSSILFITSAKLRFDTRVDSIESSELEDVNAPAADPKDVRSKRDTVSVTVNLSGATAGVGASVNVNADAAANGAASASGTESSSVSPIASSKGGKSKGNGTEGGAGGQSHRTQVSASGQFHGTREGGGGQLHVTLEGGGGHSQGPTREELQRCLKKLAENNVGGRGHGIMDKTMHGLQEISAGNYQDNIYNEATGTRGAAGMDEAGGGLLQPVDSIGGFLSSFAGYKPGQSSNRSPGTAFMNGIRSGSKLTYGLSEGAADTLGMALGVGKVSNDRSHLDSITDDLWLGITSVPAMAVDALDAIAKPLGLSPILGSLAGLAGNLLSAVGGVILSPIKLALDFGKVGVKALGLGSFFGMKGSSDNGGVKFCINHLARIKLARDQQQGKQFSKMGRSFGSEAVNMENVFAKTDYANVDMYTPLGWRGLYMHESEPFIGLGSCIVDDNITLADLTDLKTGEEAAEFYLKTLRTNCNKKQKDQLLDLLNTKELVFNPDEQTFSVSPEHFARKEKKLSAIASARFAQAFEMQEYTRAYAVEFKNLTQDLANPDNLLIHRAINTLRNFAMNFFSAAHLEFPFHSVKLTRNLIVTLKSALVRLLQSWQVVSICQRCLPQEQYVLGDGLISLISMIDFIIYKYEPDIPEDGISPSELNQSYERFYDGNRMQFAERLAAYVMPPYGKVGIPDAGDGEVVFLEKKDGSDWENAIVQVLVPESARRKRKAESHS